MKTYYRYYTYSEIAQESTENLLAIMSDGDIPKKTKDMAEVELENRGVNDIGDIETPA